MTPENNNTSGSSDSLSSYLSYDIKGDDRVVNVLCRKINELENKLHTLETQKILDETQIPKELLENGGFFPKNPLKYKRGKGYRPLLKGEIEEAKKHSIFASQQAKWLGIGKKTYRKYAELYGIYEPRPTEKGKKQPHDPNRGKYPLAKVLAGEFYGHPSVSDWIIKDKLIRSSTFEAKCNICGYDKRRIGDRKICLLLDHKDGDTKNYKLENLQLLCLNCTFECGRGYIRKGKHMFDTDWIQGARVTDIDSHTRW